MIFELFETHFTRFRMIQKSSKSITAVTSPKGSAPYSMAASIACGHSIWGPYGLFAWGYKFEHHGMHIRKLIKHVPGRPRRKGNSVEPPLPRRSAAPSGGSTAARNPSTAAVMRQTPTGKSAKTSLRCSISPTKHQNASASACGWGGAE